MSISVPIVFLGHITVKHGTFFEPNKAFITNQAIHLEIGAFGTFLKKPVVPR